MIKASHSLALVTMLPLLSGCLLEHNSQTVQSGTPVGKNTFAQIEPGVTGAGRVAAMLGPPDSRTPTGSGSDIWTWRYSETRSNSTSVFLLFGGDSSKTTQGAAYVEVENGIVTRAWRD